MGTLITFGPHREPLSFRVAEVFLECVLERRSPPVPHFFQSLLYRVDERSPYYSAKDIDMDELSETEVRIFSEELSAFIKGGVDKDGLLFNLTQAKILHEVNSAILDYLSIRFPEDDKRF